MTSALDWARDGRGWPNEASSRFVDAAGFTWHVQVAGSGPAILLLHGTGASTHSWRDLLPLLARFSTVIAPDLPGHGFSVDPPDAALTLPGMASALRGLLDALGEEPVLVIGHSAGAAVGVRMCLDRSIAPQALISLNGALLPFRAATGPIFSALAKFFALNPMVPWFFALQASNGRMVDRLLEETGSKIDSEGTECYRRLVSNQHHVAAALRMMASWDLSSVEARLPDLKTDLHLVVGTRDRTISPDQAHEVRTLQPHAIIKRLQGLGHLAHEERPDLVADYVAALMQHAQHGMAEA